jgi:hypothetical protein
MNIENRVSKVWPCLPCFLGIIIGGESVAHSAIEGEETTLECVYQFDKQIALTNRLHPNTLCTVDLAVIWIRSDKS